MQLMMEDLPTSETPTNAILTDSSGRDTPLSEKSLSVSIVYVDPLNIYITKVI